MAKAIKKFFLYLIVLPLASACQVPNNEQSAFPVSAGIIGGSEVTDSSPLAAFTVGLYDEKNGSRCTGTLISENKVLTAAHCVNPSSQQLFILFSKNLYQNGQLNKSKMRLADSFVRHENFDPSRQEGVDTYDLALVTFSGGLPLGYAPVILNSEEKNIEDPNSKLLAAGFGVSNGLFQTGGGKLRQVELEFRQMHSATEIQTVQDSRGVCSGDSGGPLVRQSASGQTIQIGVASRVATKVLGCRDFAVFTRVDLYLDWIQRTKP